MGRNVTLSDLHPSFANIDHVRRLIVGMRADYYPCGTGYDGTYYSTYFSIENAGKIMRRYASR